MKSDPTRRMFIGGVAASGVVALAPVPAFALQLSAAGKKCGFKNPAANWEFDGFRAPERWWFV